MKTRNGFVSNSSSSSFIIQKCFISPEQLELIRNHTSYGKQFDIMYSGKYDAWEITEDDKTIEGFTTMDNFDMHDFLHRIGVAKEHIIIEKR